MKIKLRLCLFQSMFSSTASMAVLFNLWMLMLLAGGGLFVVSIRMELDVILSSDA